MRILKMNLSNFQGIKKLEIDFNGENTSVYGDNATGKTTIFNAFTWLLYDKDSTGVKSYSPKTYDEEGEKHNLEHTVTAVLQLSDGRNIELKKIYKEVYKKSKGKANKEFSGHVKEYFIDGVPTKEKDYNSEIERLVGDKDKIKILTDYLYFPQKMEWKERRALLFELFGEVTDFEIMEKNEDFSDLKELLKIDGTEDQYHGVDDFVKILKEKMRMTNKEIQSLPDRIDELNSLLETNKEALLDKEGVEALNALKDSFAKQIENLKREKTLATTDTGKILSLKKVLAGVKNAYYDKEGAYTTEIRQKEKDRNDKLESYREKARKTKKDLSDTTTLIEEKKKKQEQMAKKRENLISEIKGLKSLERDVKEDVCPTCKRVLEPNKIEEAKQKFEENKKKKLEELTLKGQQECSKEAIAELLKELEELEAEKRLIEEVLKKENEDVQKIEAISLRTTEFKDTEEGKELQEKIDSIQAKINSENSEQSNLTIYDEQIEKLEKEVEEAREKIANNKATKQQVEQIESKIASLEKSEKELADLYEESEGKLAHCEDFIRLKTDYITENINKNFKTLEFKLFENQINGGLNEICTPLVPSPSGAMVPFDSANSAAKINAGIEIIGVLGKAWALELPIFVDNAESITKINQVENQIVRLVVSENDKNLRVVKEQDHE